jgi:TetR/AcrR family transcriptional repressor of mexJK operon
MSDLSTRAAAADRRQRIVLAAMRLFSEHPYGDVHMDGIAAAARVAKPTLYRYFSTKEALFIAALEHALTELGREIERIRSGAGTSEERLRRIVGLMLDRVGRLTPAIQAVEGQSSELGERSRMILRRGFSNLREAIGRLLGDGIEDGDLGGFDIELAVLVVLGAVRMAAHSAAAARTDLARSLVDIILGGLRARERSRSGAALSQSWSGVQA